MKDKKLEESVRIRMSKQQRRFHEKEAMKNGLLLSEYLRELINGNSFDNNIFDQQSRSCNNNDNNTQVNQSKL